MLDLSKYKEEVTDKSYYNDVEKDINEAKKQYKYIEKLTTFCFKKPSIIILKALAVPNDLMDISFSNKEDYLGEYPMEIYVVVPTDYRNKGCIVLGANWSNLESIPKKYFHINNYDSKDEYHELCVGVPESFPKQRNVILSSLETAHYLLEAYKLYLNGTNKKIELIAYSHGDEGRREYAKKNK